MTPEDIKKKKELLIKQHNDLKDKIDEKILGGLVVKIGSKMIDTSLYSKIKESVVVKQEKKKDNENTSWWWS